jgi:hypothetical protein
MVGGAAPSMIAVDQGSPAAPDPPRSWNAVRPGPRGTAGIAQAAVSICRGCPIFLVKSAGPDGVAGSGCAAAVTLIPGVPPVQSQAGAWLSCPPRVPAPGRICAVRNARIGCTTHRADWCRHLGGSARGEVRASGAQLTALTHSRCTASIPGSTVRHLALNPAGCALPAPQPAPGRHARAPQGILEHTFSGA